MERSRMVQWNNFEVILRWISMNKSSIVLKSFTICDIWKPVTLYQTVCFPGKYFYTFTPVLVLSIYSWLLEFKVLVKIAIDNSLSLK